MYALGFGSAAGMANSPTRIISAPRPPERARRGQKHAQLGLKYVLPGFSAKHAQVRAGQALEKNRRRNEHRPAGDSNSAIDIFARGNFFWLRVVFWKVFGAPEHDTFYLDFLQQAAAYFSENSLMPGKCACFRRVQWRLARKWEPA